LWKGNAMVTPSTLRRLKRAVRPQNMRFLLSAALAAWLAQACLAQTEVAVPSAEEQRVLAAEDEYVAAEVRRDEPALRRVIDDRFVLNSSTGSTSGKEELIQAVLKLSMVGQTIRERTVLIEGNMAIVFGTADIRFAPQGKPETTSSLRYTSTYINRDGQWRMLALQMQARAPK
jgi:hypothetical protein